ncbi:MAG: hypothetical protein NTY09_07640 [bacterium]|nr:hypothetical protein [bacterium]
MKANKNKSGKAVGLVKAWGAYIQMLVQAIVKSQIRISGMAK